MKELFLNEEGKPSFESKTMTNEQIIELYQRKLNMTLAELSAITGKSIKELKKILMGG